MENINLKFLIIFVLFLLLFFLGIFKIQANNNVNISNFIIYTPYLIDTPDYSEIENLTEIYTNEYYIKANKIKIDKKNKMIFLYNNIFIKNLRRLDEFLSDDVVIYYTENGINKIIAKK
ncbi:MAG: hypothetical protein ACP5RD_08285, partial [bacterium]